MLQKLNKESTRQKLFAFRHPPAQFSIPGREGTQCVKQRRAPGLPCATGSSTQETTSCIKGLDLALETDEIEKQNKLYTPVWEWCVQKQPRPLGRSVWSPLAGPCWRLWCTMTPSGPLSASAPLSDHTPTPQKAPPLL